MLASDILTNQETLRVSALHALAYCPRLFYLEEVEQLYTQDAAVFAGRRLHVELEEAGEWLDLNLTSPSLGLRGRLDALKTRHGQTIPYEHKRGRCYRDPQGQPQAWESDLLQVLAYCYLVESSLGITISEGRIRYHADRTLVHVPFDDLGKQQVEAAIAQTQSLRQAAQRPPVTTNDRLCTRCSLAPVCLPEEARLAHQDQVQEPPLRLFPADDDRQILHILEPGTTVGKTGTQIKVSPKAGTSVTYPAQQIGQIVLHSFSQISTQAIHFCAGAGIGVHFISGGGKYLGSIDSRQGSIQRRVQQYQALSQPEQCLALAQKLVLCRGAGQRQFLRRGQHKTEELKSTLEQIKILLKQIPQTPSLESLLGLEGKIAALYFAALPHLLVEGTPEELGFDGRNRRPPSDRFNALLSFGYALLLKDITNAILTVGLEPALGFYHQPRTQAPPLALDLMEIFRVPLVDMVVVSSINRGQWDLNADFEIRGIKDYQQVWLSDLGKKKWINLYEQRKAETWKHPVTKYSLTYRRLMELEVRLLEKEWSGEGGLFGKLILR